jgi:hypothetical protein
MWATGRTGMIPIRGLHPTDVPCNAVAKRGEESRECAVQVVAIAATPPLDDPVCGFERIDRRAPAELDLEILVGNMLDVCSMYEAKGFGAGLSRVGQAEPVQVTGHIDPARRGHVET